MPVTSFSFYSLALGLLTHKTERERHLSANLAAGVEVPGVAGGEVMVVMVIILVS